MITKTINIPAVIDAVYILHLKRSAKRKPQVERLLRVLGNKARAFDAVDSRTLTKSQIARVYSVNLHEPHYPFALSDNEIACFLSHRAMWSQIINDGHDYALILEDDVDLNVETFQSAMDIFESSPKKAFYRLPKEKRPPSPDLEQVRALPSQVGLGTQAQIVSRDAAIALLEATECFDRPVDTTIQMHWLHDAQIFEIFPSGVTEIDQNLGGSTIQSKNKSFREFIRREWRRFRYRLNIRYRSSSQDK